MTTCSESPLSPNLHCLQSKHAYAFRQKPYQTLSAASPASPKRNPHKPPINHLPNVPLYSFLWGVTSKPQPRRAQSVKRLPSLFYYCRLQLCSPPSLVTASFYMTARARPAPSSHLHHLQSRPIAVPKPHPLTATQNAQANPTSGLIICKIHQNHTAGFPLRFHAGSSAGRTTPCPSTLILVLLRPEAETS